MNRTWYCIIWVDDVGGGSHKKRRRAGHRGGRGMAGTHKGAWAGMIKHDSKHFGRLCFKVPKAVKRSIRSINVSGMREERPYSFRVLYRSDF